MATKGASKGRAPGRQTARAPSGLAAPADASESWASTWRELRRLGLVLTARPKVRPPENPDFTPVRVEGEPLSETILRERK